MQVRSKRSGRPTVYVPVTALRRVIDAFSKAQGIEVSELRGDVVRLVVARNGKHTQKGR